MIDMLFGILIVWLIVVSVLILSRVKLLYESAMELHLRQDQNIASVEESPVDIGESPVDKGSE